MNQESKKLIVLQGIPASGKSTFARDFVKGKTDWIIVSRDAIRDMRGDYWVPNQENWVSDVELTSIESALKRGFNVIIDATNLNKKTVTKWENLILSYPDYNIEFKVFKIDLQEAIRRDIHRTRSVGTVVIKTMYDKGKDLYDI